MKVTLKQTKQSLAELTANINNQAEETESEQELKDESVTPIENSSDESLQEKIKTVREEYNKQRTIQAEIADERE